MEPTVNIQNIVHDITLLSKDIPSVSFKWIQRIQNVAAHILTSGALKVDLFVSSLAYQVFFFVNDSILYNLLYLG